MPRAALSIRMCSIQLPRRMELLLPLPPFSTTVSLPSGAIASFDVIGLDPTRAETVRFYQVTDGRFLNGDDKLAAAFSQHLAQVLGLHVGDTYKLPTSQGLISLSVVGVFTTSSTDQLLVPLATAQQLFSAPGQATAIDVAITAGADRETVKQALQAKLGTDFNVGSAVSNNALAQDLQLGLVIFNIFGILTLFMGAFLIFNTFRTVVVERRHDIGMLRAVGATRGTIVRLILLESALQGIIGTAWASVLGYLLGLGLTSAFQSAMDQFMRARLSAVVPPEAIILSVVLGIGMTLLAGLLPAISAGHVPVLAALRQEQIEPAKRRANIGGIIGTAFVVLGIVGIFTGSTGLVTARQCADPDRLGDGDLRADQPYRSCTRPRSALAVRQRRPVGRGKLAAQSWPGFHNDLGVDDRPGDYRFPLFCVQFNPGRLHKQAQQKHGRGYLAAAAKSCHLE